MKLRSRAAIGVDPETVVGTAGQCGTKPTVPQVFPIVASKWRIGKAGNYTRPLLLETVRTFVLHSRTPLTDNCGIKLLEKRVQTVSIDCAIRLRLQSGVPVVDVHGEWAQSVTDALADMVHRLAEAGHYEIVVNVQRAALLGISALMSLARAAQTVQRHCGHIDFVTTAEQASELKLHQAQRVFRLAASEASALGHVKRIRIVSTDSGTTARPRH